MYADGGQRRKSNKFHGSGRMSPCTLRVALVKDLVKVCDVCHIYDNSGNKPFRIFKKRKEEVYYDECDDWYLEDIQALTDVKNMVSRNLN